MIGPIYPLSFAPPSPLEVPETSEAVSMDQEMQVGPVTFCSGCILKFFVSSFLVDPPVVCGTLYALRSQLKRWPRIVLAP